MLTKSSSDPGCSSDDGQAGETIRVVPVLVALSKTARALVATKLADVGLFNGQDEVLLALDEGAPLAVSHLADQLNVRPSTVSKMVERLILGGLVVRAQDRSDARRTIVEITPAGLDTRSSIIRIREALETEIAKALRGEDVRGIVAGLTIVQSQLAKQLARLR